MKIDEKNAIKAYNYVAEHYHNYRTKDSKKGSFFNEMLEMPSTKRLLGDARNKKVLDFGCGTGIYLKLLTKRGAKVKGFDISKKMLEIAKKENPKLDLRFGSGYKIPFKEKFDIVLASLVIDYLKDWDRVFKQVNRVLKKGGYFIFSIGNPVSEVSAKKRFGKKRFRILGDYFSEKAIYGFWKIKNKKIKMTTYHKTYETIIKIILKNNFEIFDYVDCFPLKEAKKLFSEDYRIYSKVPYFCVWKVKKK